MDKKCETDRAVHPIPYLFAGPCSAESEEQIFSVAEFFAGKTARPSAKGAPADAASTPLTAIRAGAWKPRTRPGCFEGHGEKALEWMQQAQKQYHIPFITEIASTRHIELCLKHDIQHFWIGARSSSNPFLMEEIGRALEGSPHRVWIKNPISPDLALWLGGIERIARKGKTPVGGIHRGFSMYDSAPYRNAPIWEMAVQFKREMPGVPLVCDPSHIAGARAYVQEISQSALDLEMDGFMIEVHPTPVSALSDAKQQLDFKGFEDWFAALKFRKNMCSSSQIEQMRRLLDEIDSDLIQILAHRMELVKQLGRLKKDSNVSVLQFDRWNKVMERCLGLAHERGLDADFIKKLMHCIHAEALRIQKDI